MNFDLFLDVFVALFALLNPFFAIPVFLGLTEDRDNGERRQIALVAAITVFVALVVAAIMGDQILNLFGIHVPSFQIAGGLIVLTIALNMLKDDGEQGAQAETRKEPAHQSKRDIAIYPLAIPLLAGPGVFVTTIVFASRIDSVGDFAMLSAALFTVVLVLLLSMTFATTAARYLNKTAITIGTKILGILLAAVSVEMILTGIDDHFLPLISSK